MMTECSAAHQEGDPWQRDCASDGLLTRPTFPLMTGTDALNRRADVEINLSLYRKKKLARADDGFTGDGDTFAPADSIPDA